MAYKENKGLNGKSPRHEAAANKNKLGIINSVRTIASDDSIKELGLKERKNSKIEKNYIGDVYQGSFVDTKYGSLYVEKFLIDNSEKWTFPRSNAFVMIYPEGHNKDSDKPETVLHYPTGGILNKIHNNMKDAVKYITEELAKYYYEHKY